MLWRSSLLLIGLTCSAQTAITELSSYWAMEATDEDRILWDYHGSRHGTYTGTGLELPATIFGRGVRQSGSTTGGLSIPASLVNTSGSFTFAVWCRHNGTNTIIARNHAGGGELWTLRFNSTTAGRPQLATPAVTLTMPSSAYNINAGVLALVWFSWDGTNIKLAINDSAWSNQAAPAFTNDNADRPLDIAQNQRQFNRGGTTGDMMFWDGYIPSDAERSAIWNSGSGREYTYFNASGYTPPTRPLTVSLVSSTFAVDTDLAAQGLYFLRPYPLKTWTPSLVSGRGDYVWLRSTDHTSGGIYRGYSDSPETLPSAWTLILAGTAPSTDDATYDWSQLETPYLVWNPDTSLFHLYGHAIRTGSSGPVIQVTHVWTSPDLDTWTWEGPAFPNASGRNHTGYAIVERRGTNDWIANTLLTDSQASPPSLSGFWTSTDGLTWTLAEAETATADDIFSTQKGAYIDMTRTVRIDSTQKVTALNFVATTASGTDWRMQYPQWPLFQHDSGSIQDVRTYEENGTVYLYAKWSYQEPSTIRLYKGTLPQSSSPRFGGVFRIGGAASAK